MTINVNKLRPRFWAKVLKLPGENACWEWQGCRRKHSNGYGLGYGFFGMGPGEKMLQTHRAVWILEFGGIPPGMQVLHKCDNPPCVRPDHLYLGTHAQNMQDRTDRDRLPRGTNHWRAKDPEKSRRQIEKSTAVMAANPELRARGERHGCAKLTEVQVIEIRRVCDEARAQYGGKFPRGLFARLGPMYGLDRHSVANIANRRIWKSVD